MKSLFLLLGLAVTLPAKPNILFIFADDQAHSSIAALGNEEIETPHLDQLVQQGTSFTNAYNMGAWNGAVCIASRTMILSGRSLWHAEALDNPEGAKNLIESGKTWPQLMKKAGYQTYFTGKWHAKAQPEKIFDEVRNKRPGMPNQTPAGYKRPLADGSDTWDPADPKFGGFWKGGKHWSEVVADDAELYFQEAAKKDEPFFFYLAFNAPHDPRQAPQEYLDKYPADKIKVPVNYQTEYPHMEAMKLKGKKDSLLRDENLAPLPRTELAVRVHRREYYALITHMDTQIGRILKALDKSGQRDNTIIIYSADHGLACGEHGLLGKQNQYEHSVKPPLILVGPGIPANERRDALVYLQDIVPTALELAEMPKPDFVEFESLMPLAKEAGNAAGRKAVLGSYINCQRMIRVGDYKLIVYPATQTLRLFNLAKDPHEMNDLITQPEQKERAADLLKQLKALLKEHGDPLDLRGVEI
ncbi:sulfatase-like hydrolase/transferase [Roseibacillus persicicus]|uniref:sulfatase-like hydrolase/transferase n=1 Tax=Roseibacillus persicicus TaxID=454148 RepID=UPI00398A8C2C